MKTAYFRRLVVPAVTLFLVVLSLFIAQLAFGQAAASGTIVGTVTDSTGALIGGATITIVDPATKSVRTTLSNKQGQYVVSNVPPGVYDIKTVKGGLPDGRDQHSHGQCWLADDGELQACSRL